MIETVDVEEHVGLDDYAAYIFLKPLVEALRRTAEDTRHALQNRTVWMVNSTVEGGGVAEMLPKLISLLRELGIDSEWAVIRGGAEGFFPLTKRIHNMLHGVDHGASLTTDDRRLYESTSQRFADQLHQHIAPGDVVIMHDPQPLGVGAVLARKIDVTTAWRCHIGLDQETPATEEAWNFLQPWASSYDVTVFSLEDYIPSFVKHCSEVIHPAIDPLSHKNRELSISKSAGILMNASLSASAQPVLTPPFSSLAKRVQGDGSLAPAVQPEEIGLMFRPIVAQISRWDRLKGFAPLLRGFVRLKKNRRERSSSYSERHRRRLDVVRLVLAGPDPEAIQDDPESQEVFDELRDIWSGLNPELQRDVALLSLPMESRKHNALMVNVLQRCASLVVQNSIREGFGLTITEAMWKRIPVLGTSAVGIRNQIEEDMHGQLIHDPEDPDDIARMLDLMLRQPKERDIWAQNAQRKVTEQYLVLTQVQRWLEVLHQTIQTSSTTR